MELHHFVIEIYSTASCDNICSFCSCVPLRNRLLARLPCRKCIISGWRMCLCLNVLYKRTRPAAFDRFTLENKETERFKRYTERSVNRIRTLNVWQFEIYFLPLRSKEKFQLFQKYRTKLHICFVRFLNWSAMRVVKVFLLNLVAFDSPVASESTLEQSNLPTRVQSVHSKQLY